MAFRGALSLIRTARSNAVYRSVSRASAVAAPATASAVPVTVPARMQSGAPRGGTQRSMKGAPNFRGLFFAKRAACGTLRVVHPKFRAAGDSMYVMHRQGAVALDIAAAADGGFDWRNKSTYFLTGVEIFTLVYTPLDRTVSLVRAGSPDGGAPARTLSVRPTEDRNGVVVSIEQSGSGSPVVRSLELSAAEMMMIKHLLTDAVQYITGWSHNLDHRLFDAALHLHTDAGSGGRSAPAPEAVGEDG